jgi:hypothetical protein
MFKRIGYITGVFSFLYFSLPYIMDLISWKPSSFLGYAFTFIPLWVYSIFYNLSPLKHLVPLVGLFFSFIVFWIGIYFLAVAFYDFFLDIYLNSKRFRDDRDGK